MALHIKSIKPLFTSIVTTGDKFEEDVVVAGIIQQDQKKGDLKLYQKVIAVGSAVRDIQVGDLVMINPINYVHRKYSKNSVQNDMDNNPILSIDIPTVVVEDEKGNTQECLLLNDRDIRFVFEGEEKDDSIIIPEKPKFIVN
jgi:hypothetical protein